MPKVRKGGEHEWIIIPPYRWGSLPTFVLILSVSVVVLMGFNAFGTRLQSLWIMFFCLWSEKPNAGQNLLPFRQHVTLTCLRRFLSEDF